MKRTLISLNLPCGPDPVCVALWKIYMDSFIRARMFSSPFDKWVIKETDEALDRYFDAVEDELEWLNAE